MKTVVGVQFYKSNKVYYFSPNRVACQVGDDVVVETARGAEIARVAQGPMEVEEDKIVPPLKNVLRLVTQKDRAQQEKNRKQEAAALAVFEKKIADHELVMKPVSVEYGFDGSNITFFFTADGRVDFRELVKDLASVFKTRIELRQIGVRDEAKMLGGLGICGRPFCCCSFLGEFQPVSIKMAKEQGLSLNPTKISGTCGRLMCCLKYEQNAYEDLLRITPRVGAYVSTGEGKGTVTEVSLLTGLVKVRMDKASDGAPMIFEREAVKVIRDARPQREDIDFKTNKELKKLENQ